MATEFLKKEMPSAYEMDYINMYGAFGWTVKDTRAQNSESSRLKRGLDGALYQVTTTVDRVTLIFERDTTMRNYAELAALQKNLDEIFDPDPRLVAPVKLGKAFVCISIALIWAGLLGFARNGPYDPSTGAFFLVLGGALIFWRIRSVRSWRNTVDSLVRRRDEIVEQARKIA